MTGSQQAAAPPHSEHPCPRTIALAISIVRSKPQGMSMGEYISLMRQHIAKGHRADALSTTYRHLDRSSHWRAQCEMRDQDLRVAQDEIVDLQREVEKLKAQADTSKTTGQKRKKQDGEAENNGRMSKKIKREIVPNGIEADFHGAGEFGNILLRSVYNIHIILDNREEAQTDELMHYLIRAATSVPQIVQNEVASIFQSSGSDSDRLMSSLTVASRAVSTILRGFDELSQSLTAATGLGLAIYEITRTYKGLLSSFEQLSLHEASKIQADPSATSSKTSSKGKAPKTSLMRSSSALSLYATFLADIVGKLKCTEANKSLFEGLLFCVLQYLGTRLYTSTFGQPRPSTIEEEIEQSNPTDDIEDDEGVPPDQNKELLRRQVRLEAPYLVHLLSRFLAAAPSHLVSFSGSRLAKAKQGTKNALAQSAKECLQQTLVNCMFGIEKEDEKDDLFRDCLKMPTPKDTIPMPRIKDAQTQDWFKEEMWRLLGWEILEREGGF